MQDFLGDMITRIRNGHRARLGAVLLHPYTPNVCVRLLEILRDEGYILGFQYIHNTKSKKPQIKVLLKYDATGSSVVQAIFQVSKPSRRIYISLNALWKPKTTFGVFIVSTPIGLMVDREARLRNLGGEVLCGIY